MDSDEKRYGMPREDVLRAFKMLDTDGDGKITAKQLKVLTRMLGYEITLAKARQVAGVYEGEIDFTHFLMYWECKVESEMEAAFACIDRQRRGKISRADLGAAFTQLNDETVDEMFSAIDCDGDGYIGFEEFREFIAPLRMPK